MKLSISILISVYLELLRALLPNKSNTPIQTSMTYLLLFRVTPSSVQRLFSSDHKSGGQISQMLFVYVLQT